MGVDAADAGDQDAGGSGMSVRTGITIMRGDNPAFDVILYGVTVRDICTVPSGGYIVRRTLKKMKLDPDDYWTSMFLAYPYPKKPVA